MVLAIYGRLVQGEEGLQYALKGGRQFSDKNVLSSQISDKSHNRQAGGEEGGVGECME